MALKQFVDSLHDDTLDIEPSRHKRGYHPKAEDQISDYHILYRGTTMSRPILSFKPRLHVAGAAWSGIQGLEQDNKSGSLFHGPAPTAFQHVAGGNARLGDHL